MKPDVRARFRVSVEVDIRPGVESDLPALEWMGLFSSHRDVIRQCFEAQRRGDALMLLAVANGFPVAQVWIDYARKRPEPTAYLWAIRVFPTLQRSGLGRQLMMAAEDDIRRRGLRRAELGVERDNLDAQRFYRKLGWHIAGPLKEEVRYTTPEGHIIKEHLDQWLMAKDLHPA